MGIRGLIIGLPRIIGCRIRMPGGGGLLSLILGLIPGGGSLGLMPGGYPLGGATPRIRGIRILGRGTGAA